MEFMDLVFTRMPGESYRAVVSVDVKRHFYLPTRVTVDTLRSFVVVLVLRLSSAN